MYMYIYIYICMTLYTYIYIYICIHVHAYMYIYMYVCIYTYFIYIYTYMRIYAYVYRNTHIHIYIYTYICTYVYIYAHVYTYVYMHVYTHVGMFVLTHMHMRAWIRTSDRAHWRVCWWPACNRGCVRPCECCGRWHYQRSYCLCSYNMFIVTKNRPFLQKRDPLQTGTQSKPADKKMVVRSGSTFPSTCSGDLSAVFPKRSL